LQSGHEILPAILEAAKAALIAGKGHVFDTDNFTVNGEKLTSYKADVDDFGDFAPETEVIADGYFHESEYRSAPYFDLRIDGITEINK
jgi:basic membrane protein A